MLSGVLFSKHAPCVFPSSRALLIHRAHTMHVWGGGGLFAIRPPFSENEGHVVVRYVLRTHDINRLGLPLPANNRRSYLLGCQTMAPVECMCVLLWPSLRSLFSSLAFASASVLVIFWSPFQCFFSVNTPPLRGVRVLLRGVGESIASFILFRIAASSTIFSLVLWDELRYHPSTIVWFAYTNIQGGLM